MTKAPDIQVVLVKWGTRKYSSAYVNAIVRAVREKTHARVRFVCFTEVSKGIDPDVEVRAFPDLGYPLAELTARGGSLPKLGMFRPGELLPDVPAIYIDLDSAVFGDIARLAAELTARRGLYVCSRHFVQTWRYPALMRRIAPDRYYLGNTAVMAFYPGDWHGIYHGFMRDYPVFLEAPETMHPVLRRAYVEGNERIISLAARDDIRVFSHANVTKFTEEYMAPTLWMARLKGVLPGATARRENQVIVTFHGESLKPVHLARAEPGDIFRHKFHKVGWAFPKISGFWKTVLENDRPA